jgi:hypothetical protein
VLINPSSPVLGPWSDWLKWHIITELGGPKLCSCLSCWLPFIHACPPVIGTIATKNAAGDAESVMRRGPIPPNHFHTPLPSTADPHVSVLLPFPGLINSINTNLLHPGVGTRLFDIVYLLGVSAGP